MQTYAGFDLKWRRLAIVVLTTLMIADTVPHLQLSPGLLQSLVARVQTQIDDH
ncbi:hypothetical protein IQ254_08650 [Nodosilinea sp. LEGE 07088]|uniref:hypothetical protein n=1 Tax=Nodosilinea sp. LEGE 07088 TaxID=2777968 RepID=UPI001880B279|nr:hypothetical protein [Nodosilinea sp. LEGE 07088]MBE9137275.1 hypothetical protein [Nodosilinea sp. LEGE 07088]